MPKFHIHVNRELTHPDGTPKKYYSSRDYVADMKKAGLEPKTEGGHKLQRKDYQMSDKAREMIHHAVSTNGKVGDRFYNELSKMGYSREKIARGYQEARKASNER